MVEDTPRLINCTHGDGATQTEGVYRPAADQDRIDIVRGNTDEALPEADGHGDIGTPPSLP